VDPSLLLLQPFIGLLCQNWRRDGDDDLGAIHGMSEWQGKPEYSEKTCRRTGLSTTDLTWLCQESNPYHPGGKPANTRLSYGTVLYSMSIFFGPVYGFSPGPLHSISLSTTPIQYFMFFQITLTISFFLFPSLFLNSD
jgi:hypothetical protein